MDPTFKKKKKLGMVIYICNSPAEEAEMGGRLKLTGQPV